MSDSLSPEDFGLTRDDWDEEHWRYHIAVAAAFTRSAKQTPRVEIEGKQFFPYFIESYGDMAQIVMDAIRAWSAVDE